MNKHPSWLKSMQHGSIGEARTRAFLIDRFWILERSVDIQGADFIIQRRVQERNILDDTPIRFGVVQAKYSQDGNTSHRIKKDFLIDTSDKKRLEFFLIIHSGGEESNHIYLLSSDDIIEGFPENDGIYNVASNKVFSSKKFKVKNKKLALDRIEASIQCAEFYKNRYYIFKQISSEKPDFDAILPEYKEEINQSFGTIPEVFKEQKKLVYDELLNIEQLHKYLRKILESVDPIETFFIAESLRRDFDSTIRIPDFFAKDFYYDAKNIKEMAFNMRSDGILDNYFMLKSELTKELNEFLQSIPPKKLQKESVHKISIVYNAESLKIVNLENSLYDSDPTIGNEFSVFNKAQQGEIIYSWNVGLTYFNGNVIRMNDICLINILNKIYALKYYEGEEV